LVSQRTGIVNQIRAFLLERGIAMRQGQRFLRAELPRILATPPDVLSPRMVRMIEVLTSDWRRLDERVERLSDEIEAIDAGCERLMSVPGIGPIISSAMVAAIGAGDVFTRGRDFAAWLGLVLKQISTGDRTILGKISRRGNRYYLRVLFVQGTHPTSAVLSEAWYFAKRVTLSLALRSSCDAGRSFRRVGAAAALVAG
jgi:transposase